MAQLMARLRDFHFGPLLKQDLPHWRGDWEASRFRQLLVREGLNYACHARSAERCLNQ
jgi:hypothetical protein